MYDLTAIAKISRSDENVKLSIAHLVSYVRNRSLETRAAFSNSNQMKIERQITLLINTIYNMFAK